ncbi:hypothetical protein DPMN_113439 [Dreissena polymorpha]|uniref:Uncharacterized protein n=1 Tax=Dreissena polymorpha TaxID=45954 RepID=A0A9D4QR01_DREPO|nr:hypothetical protein DPMN_113439 [Dreissena polymorpha]
MLQGLVWHRSQRERDESNSGFISAVLEPLTVFGHTTLSLALFQSNTVQVKNDFLNCSVLNEKDVKHLDLLV